MTCFDSPVVSKEVVFHRSRESPAQNRGPVFALESCLEARYTPATSPSSQRGQTFTLLILSFKFPPYGIPPVPQSLSQSFLEALESYIRGPMGQSIKLSKDWHHLASSHLFSCTFLCYFAENKPMSTPAQVLKSCSTFLYRETNINSRKFFLLQVENFHLS